MSFTWLLLVNYDFQAVGGRFPVHTTSDDIVYDLKEKAKEKLPETFSRARIDPPCCTVWRTKGELVIDNSTAERSEAILQSIDVDDEDTIQRLMENDEVVDLGLSDGETLLVRMPGFSLDELMMSQVDGAYRKVFLCAITKGEFTKNDMFLNGIQKKKRGPEFVEDLEMCLSQTRRASDDQMHNSAEYWLGDKIFKTYFRSPRATTAISEGLADEDELKHLVLINANGVIPVGVMRQHIIPFKKGDADWLFCIFFGPFALHLESKSQITVKYRQDSWPFPLIIRVRQRYCIHEPKSDFLVLKCDLPRMAVEVGSYSPDRAPLGRHRLMLQGAWIVRYANRFLDTYKNNKFFFVAIFISHDMGEAVRHILYEAKENVYFKERKFLLKTHEGATQFALELYNFASALDTEKGGEDVVPKVKNLTGYLQNLGTKNELSMFTRETRSSINSLLEQDGDDSQDDDDRPKGNGGEMEQQQLEACGYIVVPDVLETDHGTWEPIDKLPDHVYVVYQRDDPNQTKMIAKAIRKRSKERHIFDFISSMTWQSPHVISLFEIVPSTTRKWLILPKMSSLNHFFMDQAGSGARTTLGWGLIKGLAYLHEHNIAHRDIKPANLVCDRNYRLQIIDFDVAIEVQDEDTEVDNYRGTRGWTAPEMGQSDEPTPMHSPIKADRWSCGRVLLRHILVRGVRVGGDGDRLCEFADQLTAHDPQERPSLVNWRRAI